MKVREEARSADDWANQWASATALAGDWLGIKCLLGELGVRLNLCH